MMVSASSEHHLLHREMKQDEELGIGTSTKRTHYMDQSGGDHDDHDHDVTNTSTGVSFCCFSSNRGGGGNHNNRRDSLTGTSSSPTKPTRRKKLVGRTCALRVVLVVSLTVAATLCAVISYQNLRDMELALGAQTYGSVAALALEGAGTNLLRRLQGAGVMAQIMSYGFPDAPQWPFVSLNGYTEINRDLGKMSTSTEHGLLTLVYPDNAQEFENFTKHEYEERNYPNYTGYSEFGFGIYKYDFGGPYSDGRVPDNQGETDWGSPYDVMAPIVHVAIKEKFDHGLWNVHADKFMGSAIDSILDCANLNLRNGRVPPPLPTTLQEDYVTARWNVQPQPPCTVVTDVMQMIHRDGPAGLIFTPVYPENDPNKLVALIATTVFWEDVLINVVPDYIDGLTVVVSTDTHISTFEITNGVPVLLGEGDQHDPAYDSYAHSTKLNAVYTGATASTTYTFTIYPNQDMMNQFRTTRPLAVSLGFLGVILFCTIIFFLYDFLMRNEVRERNTLLEMKRRFVRFISHEIRTPLNTVCMGLELLASELHASETAAPDGSSQGGYSSSNSEQGGMKSTDSLTTLEDEESRASGNGGPENEDARFRRQVTQDIIENTRAAVDILNELLHWDEISTGSLKLEISAVSILKLLQTNVQQFQVQATKRKVRLILASDNAGMTTGDSSCAHHSETNANTDCYSDTACELEGGTMPGAHHIVVGDEMRLGQAIRNIISNAFKFTKEGGAIQISAIHLPRGLRGAQPVRSHEASGPHPLTLAYSRAGSLQIRIHDSGVGMSSDQLKQLFGERVQFDRNKLQHGGGSGLGLAITKGIVEQHGGTIVAESAGFGTGTTFIIELPLYKDAEALEIVLSSSSSSSESGSSGSSGRDNQPPLLAPDSSPSPQQPQSVTVSAPQPPPTTRRTRRILVVEDVLSSQKMLVKLLERAGYTCATALNGELAVQAIAKDMAASANDDDQHIPFDTILMDFEMPIMNGPDATKAIREMGYKGIIFGVTGNLLKEDVDLFKSHGATDVLGKPISTNVLESCWEKHTPDYDT